MTYTVAAFYQFAPFDDLPSLREALSELCSVMNCKGTILVAHEGVNGTVSGKRASIDAVLGHIRGLPGCSGLDVKFSVAKTMPFHRMKVRVKKEIVTLGLPEIDPARDVGTYVEADQWNDLITDPDTIVIDTRNDYEVAIGSFKGALDPKTKSFSEFPDWFRSHRKTLGAKPRVAMFCTGGIRCEKSTAFLRAEGVEDVFHLKGGILKYLETVPEDQSLWEGACFVFDERVAVGHGLVVAGHTLCRACRMPLGTQERAAIDFIEGVQCLHCVSARSEADRARYAERHKQVLIAEKRGKRHVGA
jgi:UPF0176 protein